MSNRGNITQISKEKNSWKIRVELQKDYITGKRKQKCFTFYGNKTEANKYLTEKLRELDTGALINAKKLKFGDYLDYWLTEHCENSLSINTVDTYRMNSTVHIKPTLGNIELEKITPFHLQKFYSDKIKNGLSKNSVKLLHRIIHSALEKAVKWKLISINIAHSVESPKVTNHETTVLNEDQTNILIEKVKSTEMYIPILIAIYTGMRRGEVLGLTWDNINFDKAYIKVEKALYHTSKGIMFLPPKTKKSIRTISIPNSLVEILQQHKKHQLENKMKYGELYQDKNLVCCHKDGKWFIPEIFSIGFKQFLSDNRLPIIRLHDLRHSHASLLVKLGIQPKLISERLGHSNISITMNLYAHIYEEADEQVALAFDTLINTKTVTKW